jgi:glycosyltransferase involved in cell wall biosynthesis
MDKKINLLIWGDFPLYTGYGTVVRNIFLPLYKTGKFEIDQIAINYHGDFFEKEVCPWQVTPARLLDPQDPYGTQMFINAVQKKDYDLIWIINDSFIAAKPVETLRKLFQQKGGKKRPKIIYYYPVDIRLKPEHLAMIEYADQPIAYAKYGFDETIKLLPHLKDRLRIIHHGCNTSNFFPYSKEIIVKLKKQLFNLEESDYLIINVNRNTMRKQLWRVLEAFKKFRETVPNSYLYLHTNPNEKRINLLEIMEQMGLKLNKDVFFPPNYSPTNGYPDEVLNQLYNCADMFLTCANGEGWGLATTEAMAAGIPIVAPEDSVNPEIIGKDRGYLYPTKEFTYFDLSGIRPIGLISDVVEKMLEVHKAGWKHSNSRVVKARKWIEANDWTIINQQWLRLFEELLQEEKTSIEIQDMIIGDSL